jgi:hypothetical protein
MSHETGVALLTVVISELLARLVFQLLNINSADDRELSVQINIEGIGSPSVWERYCDVRRHCRLSQWETRSRETRMIFVLFQEIGAA